VPKGKFIIGGLIIVAAIGFLGFRLVSMSTPSLSVTELSAQESRYRSNGTTQQTIDLAGKVVPGSVKSDDGTNTHRFVLQDIQTGQGNIPVVYVGSLQDTFKEDNDVLVTGYLGADGVFYASKLDPKCPSKYEPV
jgi:cytochrome c-type biogenesis protein CcmE